MERPEGSTIQITLDTLAAPAASARRLTAGAGLTCIFKNNTSALG